MVKDKFAISVPRRCNVYCLLHFANAFQPAMGGKANWRDGAELFSGCHRKFLAVRFLSPAIWIHREKSTRISYG